MPVENKIKEYREQLRISQEQLAKKSGVGRSTICEAENSTHTPSLEVALKLAQALETTVDDLFRLVL